MRISSDAIDKPWPLAAFEKPAIVAQRWKNGRGGGQHFLSYSSGRRTCARILHSPNALLNFAPDRYSSICASRVCVSAPGRAWAWGLGISAINLPAQRRVLRPCRPCLCLCNDFFWREPRLLWLDSRGTRNRCASPIAHALGGVGRLQVETATMDRDFRGKSREVCDGLPSFGCSALR